MTWLDRDKINCIISQQKRVPTLVSRVKTQTGRRENEEDSVDQVVLGLGYGSEQTFPGSEVLEKFQKIIHLLLPEACGNSSLTIRLATCNILAGFEGVNYNAPQQYRQGKWTNPILMKTIIQFYIIGLLLSPGQLPTSIHL